MVRAPRITSTQVIEMARAPSNKQFFALWRRLRLPSGQPPTFADFNLNQLGDLAASIAILQPTDVGDFFYSYFGTRIGTAQRRDLTGHYHSEIDHPIADLLANCFREVIESGRPLLVTHGNMRSRVVHTWEAAIVPVETAFGRQVVMNSAAVAFKSDLIGSILQSSPSPILACAVDIDRGKGDLAIRIQAASQSSEALFGVPVENLVGSNPFDLLPAKIHTAFRVACLQVQSTDEMMGLTVTLGQAKLGGVVPEQAYDVMISPFDGGLVLTFCVPNAVTNRETLGSPEMAD